jgi:hypothetical protein
MLNYQKNITSKIKFNKKKTSIYIDFTNTKEQHKETTKN